MSDETVWRLKVNTHGESIARLEETRLVTVTFTYGASSYTGSDDYTYTLKNLRRREQLDT